PSSPCCVGCSPVTCARQTLQFLCTHRSDLRPRQYRPERAKKSVKKIVQNCAVLCSSEVPIENAIPVIFITGLFPFPVVVSVRNEAG
ncbi:hypothetical protein ACE2EQ_004828, partial [Salmonella enterica]